MSRVVIVGGGVVGTMHVWAARRAGHDVVQVEADEEPRRASVRNFGLVWVSGRAPGPELALALRARARWEELGRAISGIGFRPDGSLTVAAAPGGARGDGGAGRRSPTRSSVACSCSTPTRRGRRTPRCAVSSSVRCSARVTQSWSPARCSPRCVCTSRWEAATSSSAGGSRPRSRAGKVRDHTGAIHHGDVVVVCPGAIHDGVAAEFLAVGARAAVPAPDAADPGSARAPHHRARRRRLAPLLPGVPAAVGGRAPGPGARRGRVPGPAPGRAARVGRADDRRHPPLRRAVRLRRRRAALRAPARPGRVAARRRSRRCSAGGPACTRRPPTTARACGSARSRASWSSPASAVGG